MLPYHNAMLCSNRDGRIHIPPQDMYISPFIWYLLITINSCISPYQNVRTYMKIKQPVSSGLAKENVNSTRTGCQSTVKSPAALVNHQSRQNQLSVSMVALEQHTQIIITFFDLLCFVHSFTWSDCSLMYIFVMVEPQFAKLVQNGTYLAHLGYQAQFWL